MKFRAQLNLSRQSDLALGGGGDDDDDGDDDDGEDDPSGRLDGQSAMASEQTRANRFQPTIQSRLLLPKRVVPSLYP